MATVGAGETAGRVRAVDADDSSATVAILRTPGAPADVEQITSFDGRRLNVAVAFDPVVDLRKMATVGRRVEPRLTLAETGEPLVGAARLSLLASDMERVDLITLDRALEWLSLRGASADEGAKGSASLIVSVSFLTASSQRARTRFTLHPGPLKDRVKSSVIWALSDVAEGAPRGRLTEVTSLLKPFGRAVFADTKLGSPAMRSARSAGISGLVIGPLAELSLDNTALWLLQAGMLAHRAAPTLIAANLASPELLPMAAAAGFTHATLRKGVVLLAA